MAHVREKPPLRVKMDIQTPGGKHYRWAEDEPSPENVPSGLRWSDTMPGGFETMDCVLPRKPGVDYADLEQLSTIRVLGASGDIAGEYRLERAPRTSGDQVSVSPGAVGWQAHLEDDKSAAMVYIGRDLSLWRDPGLPRKIAMNAVPYAIGSVDTRPVGGASAALRLSHSGSWTTTAMSIEAYYDAPLGTDLAGCYFDWQTSTGVGTGGGAWIAGAFSTEDEVAFFDSSADLLTGAASSGSLTYAPATPRRMIMVQLHYAAAGGADGVDYEIFLSNLAVYGSHGLTKRGTAPDQGFYASDGVGHAVGVWAPLLNVTTESVQASSFVIPHLAFMEPTTAGEIVRQATRFGLQDWGVWDNKTFWWHERGAFSKRWRSRVSPAQLDETGPQVDRLWESIIVQYQDVDGSTKTVGPPGSGANTESVLLKDSDPENPANQLGIIRRDVLQMGTSTAAGATEVGRRFLEQAKVLDRSGRARLVGHVEDDKGVLHPYWRPRAGDYIAFLDAADTSYRRIVKTDKDHSARTCGLDLDAPPEGLQALLERLGVVLVPLGVG